jgi:hypothetical protein
MLPPITQKVHLTIHYKTLYAWIQDCVLLKIIIQNISVLTLAYILNLIQPKLSHLVTFIG